MLVGQKSCDRPGRRFARVAGVGLERKPEKRDLPVGERVEHRLEQARDDPFLLVVVHPDHLRPVLRRRVEPERLAEIHKIQHILLEAAPAKAGARLEELGADAVIRPDHARHLVHIGAGRLAKSGNGVDGTHALGKERVRRKLGKLGGPHVRREDPLARHPRGVNVGDGPDRRLPRLVLRTADQHAIGLKQIPDGRALGEKLGVRQHGEAMRGMVVQDRLHRGGRPHRQRGLLDNDLVALREALDLARRRLPELQIARAAHSASEHLRRRVDAHENDVARLDRRRDIRGKEQVPPADFAHDLHQPRLVDRQREIGRVPRRNPLRVDVDHDHPPVRVHLGDDRHRRTADIAGADADNIRVHVVNLSFRAKTTSAPARIHPR